MFIKTLVLWCLVNSKDFREVPGISEEESKISSLMPMVGKLFPGINYYSVTGFTELMLDCATPVLKKKFPNLLEASWESISDDSMTKIATFLPSDKYEWQDSPQWKSRFNELLAAT